VIAGKKNRAFGSQEFRLIDDYFPAIYFNGNPTYYFEQAIEQDGEL
jgi:hypothetical protein